MEDDYNASAGWAFHFEEVDRRLGFGEGEAFTLKLRTSVRGAPFRAGCALLLACACVPASAAQQDSISHDSTSNAAAKKPASATTSTAPHHKTTKTTTTSAAKKPATRPHTASSGKRSSHKKPVRVRGQQKIDSERAQAIQEALIREHYLTGEPTGTWNQNSEEAMRRYQADHGWQSKEVPDSRALIKLGLGPSKDHLLNPESAMTTVPDPPRAEPMPTTSHSAAPGADPPPRPTQTDSSRPQ
jgi:putative peptidoglycan binding protein